MHVHCLIFKFLLFHYLLSCINPYKLIAYIKICHFLPAAYVTSCFLKVSRSLATIKTEVKAVSTIDNYQPPILRKARILSVGVNLFDK